VENRLDSGDSDSDGDGVCVCVCVCVCVHFSKTIMKPDDKSTGSQRESRD